MKYTKDHEWIKVKDNMAIIGITKYAADALGELVYVELPEIGNNVSKGDAFAVVESSKSASDVYAPLSGEIAEVNNNLESQPELVNDSSDTDGWIVKIKFDNIDELSDCLNEEEYKKIAT